MDTLESYIIAALIAISLLFFSRQILRLCIGLFVSVTSIILAIVSVVLCVLLIFVVAAPTVVLTCYAVGQVAGKDGTHSRLVERFCDVKTSRSDVTLSRKY